MYNKNFRKIMAEYKTTNLVSNTWRLKEMINGSDARENV